MSATETKTVEAKAGAAVSGMRNLSTEGLELAGPDGTTVTLSDIKLTLTEQRVVDLLSDGHSQTVVAMTLGLSDGRVSQIYNDPNVRALVTARRTASLQAATIRDNKLDSLEDKLIERMERSVDRVHDPLQQARMFTMINAAKRRGVQADSGPPVINQTVVNLTMPTKLIHKYTANDARQVVEVNGEALVTMPSDQLQGVHNARQEAKIREEQERALRIAAKGHRLSEDDI